ncbi:MAG: phosphate regulon transcriptional regulator PhoB [Candidatus Competibacteraceae bacterium]|nr:phosphate regulon transcriptional regulator PhoB [Candidatus Competibacteraceae bacterium]MCB1811616.1 phosphate regulon transcriptional regulator PhoB [Candidatus Competibacteraceae bacterium]
MKGGTLVNAHNILIVEDEQPIREMLCFALGNAGFNVSEATDAYEAQTQLAQGKPALILLDWMLPGISGIDFARRLKRQDTTRDVPIIMLTAKGEENHKVQGLESGADDYITKPFSTRELIARIKAVLRRSGDDERLQVAELQLDTASHRVTVNGQTLDIGPTEYRLLHFFMSHPERVYSRSQLLDQVWGSNVYVEERTVDVHIRRLRRVLETFGYDRFVQTVRGAGYRFSEKE